MPVAPSSLASSHADKAANKANKKEIWIIHGPNLSTVGQRMPEIYGTQPLGDYLTKLQIAFADTLSIKTFQSNHEGALIDTLEDKVLATASGLVINPGALAHTSLALADAVEYVATQLPVVEVHLSNIYAREAFRHKSHIARHAKALICGCGPKGIELALHYLQASLFN